MSRPRSEGKRKAILDAALRVFAERGIADSPTSAISKAAGVSEGSLFTYFKSKEELMNELYLEFRREFGRQVMELPRGGNVRTRLRRIWDKYLEMGTAHPDRLRVQTRLRASGKLYKENEAPLAALQDIVQVASEAVGGSELRKVSPEFIVLVMRAQAEVAIEFIAAHPESRDACWEMGFRILWKGLSGK
jgi:AcrR family transcriptional regulator